MDDKIKTIVKRFTSSSFIGKQLTRLRNGMSYFTFFASIISLVALVKIAYPSIEFEELVIFIVPFFIFGAYFFGYFVDVTNIRHQEDKKQIEITHRTLNIADIKHQEFELWKSITHSMIIIEKMDGKTVTPENIIDRYFETYEKYKKKWESE